ncbi:hypothetical protein [Mycobacteroides abscessus]|uniref:hypothetical protein n=1 Tax=Mycobacteroides abscessus TaxID=36809 RepID=UPI000926B3A5|nr:hypothetical protein [Mycobacteroides abscessus]SIM21952.1 Uncharacterised protein [Mycobacteroides abscessus subsp. abscessus]
MSACPYAWCTNDVAKHVDHWNDGETTAALNGPKSVIISCNAMVTLDGQIYPDEVMLCVRSVGEGPFTATTVGEGIGLALTVEEAQQLHRLLEVAMACRAEIRGSDG